MTRHDVTELVVYSRMKRSLSWAEIAERLQVSKEYATSALLGQNCLTERQAKTAGEMLGLPEDAVMLLQQSSYKEGLPTLVPTDPLVYRFYEVLGVYGTTFKELIHEEFGDGIMSAIDFNVKVEREENEKGDRVNVTLSGKFLPYATF